MTMWSCPTIGSKTTMNVDTRDGTVPRKADILILGVSPNNFNFFEQMTELRLRRLHTGWDCVVNFDESFENVIGEFLPKRPELDLVFIANQVGASPDELRSAATKMSFELARHRAKPCVVLTPDLAWMAHIFDTRQVKICSSIEAAMTARYEKKCEAARAAA